jgi:tetratricopeptide (TPR) repeat protein
MIKNTNEILTQNIGAMECIIKELIKECIELEGNKELTINTAENLAVKAVQEFTNIVLSIIGSLLSNIETDKTEVYCECGKRMVTTKRNAITKIFSILGYIPVERDIVFCRRCHKGFGINDKELGIYGEHRITKAMTEAIAYVAQMVPSFERASEAIKKLLKLEISPTQIQIISEEVGKEVFEKDKAEAREAFEKPEEAAPSELPKDQKEGRLYILTDGLQVNTRIEDINGSTWKEMKLGLIFNDKDVIRRGDGSYTIVKKEYVCYFGSIEEFKKLVFAAAARAGYGKIKEIVVLGDGATWIWNMCKELFPDAVQILDFYHMSENIHNYAKFIYPEDEVGRKIWVNKVLNNLNSGKIEEAIELVKEKTKDKIPDGVVNLYTYITNNMERINYKFYKDNDYYIGSGAIESANKMVIQQRMKQSGMRWSVNGGQYIATLRTKHESNRWDEVTNVINAS